VTKVILVVPGSLTPHGVHLEDKFDFAVETLALGYLAASLEARGIEAVCVDGYAHRQTWQETLEDVVAAIEGPCMLGFSLLQAITEAARLMIQGLRERGCQAPIALGGWLPTAAPQDLMAWIPEAAFLLQGEAEDTLPQLVAAWRTGAGFDAIAGLVWRGPDGLIANPHPPTLIDVETLPFPRHYLQDSDDEALRQAPLPMQSSRGCHWGVCTFCSTAGRYGHKGWRLRSIDHLMAEIDANVDAFGTTHISFVDDSFLGPHDAGIQRAHQLIKALKERKYGLVFSIDCLITDIEAPLFAALQEAGLRQVFVGVDSGSKKSLKRFRKGFTPQQALQQVRLLQDLGLEVVTGYIGFEPYMGLDEVRDTIEFLAHDLGHTGNPAKYLRRYFPNHNTPLWHRLKKDGLLTGDFPDWSFQFKHAQVAQLYETLTAESQPLCQAYLDEGLYRADTAQKRARCVELNAQFLALFEALYTRAEAQ